MNAIVQVVRNAIFSGPCGIYNDFTEQAIMEKWKFHKDDYTKYEKGKFILLLYIDGKQVDKFLKT